MMIAKIVREPAAILGVLVALFGLLVAFGINLTDDQIASALGFIGALIVLLRQFTIPAGEVITQLTPEGNILPGPAADKV